MVQHIASFFLQVMNGNDLFLRLGLFCHKPSILHYSMQVHLLLATLTTQYSSFLTLVLYFCSNHDCHRSSNVTCYRCSIPAVSKNLQRTPSSTQSSFSWHDCICFVHYYSHNHGYCRTFSR